MAKKQRQAYTEDFRREAVRRSDQPGNTAVSVAKEGKQSSTGFLGQ